MHKVSRFMCVSDYVSTKTVFLSLKSIWWLYYQHSLHNLFFFVLLLDINIEVLNLDSELEVTSSTMDMKKKTQHFMIDKQKIEQSFEDIQTLFFRLTTVINYWNDENYLRAVDWLQNLDTVRYDLFQNNSNISIYRQLYIIVLITNNASSFSSFSS